MLSFDWKIAFYTIPQSLYGTGSWNPCLLRTKIRLSCIFNIIAADSIVKLGAMASAAMILMWYYWNIAVSAPEGLAILRLIVVYRYIKGFKNYMIPFVYYVISDQVHDEIFDTNIQIQYKH